MGARKPPRQGVAMTNLEYEDRYGEWPAEVADPNEREQRVDEVADKHFRTMSPAFVEWLGDDLDMSSYAELLVLLRGDVTRVQMAKGIADRIYDDWRAAVANANLCHYWPAMRKIAEEVERG